MAFKTGTFDKSKISPIWRKFAPAHAKGSLVDVDLEDLWNRGKRLILLDVDHTLLPWGHEEFPENVLKWVEQAKSRGFDLCVLSNTRKKERLARLTTKLGIETVQGRFKPSPAMFRLALIKFKKQPSEAIMIGDQLFTDVLGANRSGIEAIWVGKMNGPEFAGTKVSRLAERLLRSTLYRALISPVDEPDTDGGTFWERPIVRQLVKFCIVGVSSFAVDFALRWVMMFMIPWKGDLLSRSVGLWLHDRLPGFFTIQSDASDAAFPLIVAIAAAFAILNSFIWNRRWTFQIRGKEERLAQLRRFYLISVVGLVINTLVSRAFYAIIPGHPKRSLAVATVLAAVIVAVWNFAGQRLYAFKPRS